MNKKKKIYPSSSAFADVGNCITQYSSGCFRMILAQANGFWSDIDPKYKKMGAHDEDIFIKDQVNSSKWSCILWEIPYKQEVNESVTLSGRKDFLLLSKKTNKWILVEKKSHDSYNTIREMRKGNPKMNNIAQLTSYMLDENMIEAYLSWDGYKVCKKTGEYISTTTREGVVDKGIFNIQFFNGDIVIDGRLSGYKVEDYINHLYTAGKHVADNTLSDRPITADGSFNSPCRYCNLSEVCDKVDENNLTADEFINLAKETMND